MAKKKSIEISIDEWSAELERVMQSNEELSEGVFTSAELRKIWNLSDAPTRGRIRTALDSGLMIPTKKYITMISGTRHKVPAYRLITKGKDTCKRK